MGSLFEIGSRVIQEVAEYCEYDFTKSSKFAKIHNSKMPVEGGIGGRNTAHRPSYFRKNPRIVMLFRIMRGWILLPLGLFAQDCSTKYEEISPDLAPLNPSVEISDSTWGWKLYDEYGNQYLFSEAKGRTIFLNSWATWCQPCLAELPGLQRMYDSLKTEGIELFFVTEENSDVVRRFLNKNGYTIPVFFSRDAIPTQLRTGLYPTTFLIDPMGRIVYRVMRSAKWDNQEVLRKIRGVSRERGYEEEGKSVRGRGKKKEGKK